MKRGSPKLQRSNPSPKSIGKYVYFENRFEYDFKLNKIYEGVNKTDGKLDQYADEKVIIKRIFKKFTLLEMLNQERQCD